MSDNEPHQGPITLSAADLDFSAVREGVRMARLINDPMPTPFGGGVIEFDGGVILDWTLPYDEVSIVLAGELRIQTREGVISVTRPGEMVLIPKGSTVNYEADPGTRLVYVVHPRNWRSASV